MSDECQRCGGGGELVTCVNDGSHGCSHTNDIERVCPDCNGTGETQPSEASILPCPGIWTEVAAERERAHAKHRDTSMEQQPVDALLRLSILTEEVGEVAKEMNDARHFGRLDHAALRKELIQVAAMAGAWAAALTSVVEAEVEAHRMSVCRWCDHESGDHIFGHGYDRDGCTGCDCDGYAAPLPPPSSGPSGAGETR